jgi:nucleotide-binding universal stress UspA family protein
VKLVVWLAEGTWQAGVDAALRLAPPDAEVTLLHVVDPRWASGAEAAQAGLLGRGRRRGDVGELVASAALTAEQALLDAAAARLGRPAVRLPLRGRVEREVVAAVADADLLVAVRDGDHDRLGPRSLAPPTRFVVDHAPCPVLLVWPDEAPPLATMPPPPPPGAPPGPPPGRPPGPPPGPPPGGPRP